VEQLRVFIRAPTAAIVEDDPLNENVDVDVGGARAETEEAVTDSFFDDTEGDLTPSA
jgi:hypothetical protein